MSEIRSQATPARDELAADIARAAREIDECFDIAHESTELAERLMKVGWARPYKVNTAQALDVLPSGTLIRSATGAVFERHGDQWVVSQLHYGRARQNAKFPMTVLFTPGEAG